METDGAPFTPSLCQRSILRVFKATAAQIREKSEQTLESLRIELGTSSTKGSALTNCATRLLLNIKMEISRNAKESFKTFPDPNRYLDYPYNLTSSSLYHFRQFLKISSKSVTIGF